MIWKDLEGFGGRIAWQCVNRSCALLTTFISSTPTKIEKKIPKKFKSGAYAVILRCMKHKDAITFFVSAMKGKPKSNLCVLIPTFTYLMYCNHARSEFSNKWRLRAKKWKKI